MEAFLTADMRILDRRLYGKPVFSFVWHNYILGDLVAYRLEIA